MLLRTAQICYGAALITLPWVGVGTIHLLTGRDLGAGLQPSWLLLAVATVCLALDLLRRGEWRRLTSGLGLADLPGWWRWAVPVAGGVLLVSALGIVLAPVNESPSTVWMRFFKQLLQAAIMGAFVLWPALWTRGRGRWHWTVELLTIGLLLQLGYSLLQGIHYFRPLDLMTYLERIFTSNPAILSGSEQLYLGHAFRDIPRLRGTVCEPLYLGNYLLMVLPWLLLRRAGRGAKLIGLAGVLLLVLTWSRGAWLGAGVALMVALILKPRIDGAPSGRDRPHGGARVWPWWAWCLALAVGVVLLVWQRDLLLLPLQRILQSLDRTDWSNLTRIYSMQAAWRAFLLSPVVGVGWGQFPWHFPLLVDPMGLQSQFTWPVVNNFYLQILCETGVLGLLLLTLFVLDLGRSMLKKVLGIGTATDRRVTLAAAVAAVGVWSQLMTFSQYNLPHIWLTVGLCLAALKDDEVPAGACEEGTGSSPTTPPIRSRGIREGD